MEMNIFDLHKESPDIFHLVQYSLNPDRKEVKRI